MDTAARPTLTFGIGSLLAATLALIIAVTHITAGPFAPNEPVEKTIAEAAVSIRDYAKSALTGEPVAERTAARAEADAWDIDRIISIVTPILAGLAMVLAIIGFTMREKRSIAMTGFTLGSSVLFMLWFQALVFAIVGAIILAAIILNIGDLLGGF